MESEKNTLPVNPENTTEAAVKPGQTDRPQGDVDYATLEAAHRLVNPDLMFNVGNVLSSTLGITFKNPLLFFGLAIVGIVAFIPFVFLAAQLPGQLPALCVVPLLIIGMTLQAAVTYAVFQIKTSGKGSILKALKRGLARFLPVLVLALLMGIGISIGTVLLFIPGIIVMCMTAAAIPACVVERVGPIASLKRSAKLTNGCWLKIFLLYLALGFINMLIMFVPLILFSITNNEVVLTISMLLVMCLPMALQTVIGAVIYYELRQIKEGVSVDKMVGIFD